jgi:hypothetical protein
MSGNRFDAFFQGLRDLGYANGQNIAIDYPSVEGHGERFPALAAECLRLKAGTATLFHQSLFTSCYRRNHSLRSAFRQRKWVSSQPMG